MACVCVAVEECWREAGQVVFSVHFLLVTYLWERLSSEVGFRFTGSYVAYAWPCDSILHTNGDSCAGEDEILGRGLGESFITGSEVCVRFPGSVVDACPWVSVDVPVWYPG